MSDEEIARMVRARGLAVARQLFVMFAHMYHSHLEEIIALRMHSHMNTTLRMFVLFNKENDLMPVEEMSNSLKQNVIDLRKMIDNSQRLIGDNKSLLG